MTTAQPTDTRSQVFGPPVVCYDDRVLTPRPGHCCKVGGLQN